MIDMSRRRRRRHPRRGYALLIVLLVLMLLAAAVGSLATLLDATIAEGRKTTSTIRADLACGSALDLAARTVTAAMKNDPSLSPADLVARLCTLGACEQRNGATLPSFLAPAGTTFEQFTIAYTSPKARTTRAIPDGPFKDRIAVEQSLTIFVELRDTITRRPCTAIDRYVVPSLPLASFPLFGTAPRTRWKPRLSVRRIRDGAPSLVHLNGNVSGTQISSSDFDLPGPQFSGDPLPVDLLNSTRGSDQVLAPSVGSPAMSAKQAALPRSLRWLVEPPRATDADTLRAARLAQIADIVIVDGVWYSHRDKTKPWPGKPVWSDHGGVNVSHTMPTAAIVNAEKIGRGDLGIAAADVPTLYSWYDRTAPDAPIVPNTGVLSYGPLFVTPASPCDAAAESRGGCETVEPGVWPGDGVCGGGAGLKRVGSCADAGDAIVDGARGGFRDRGRDIWPINIDLGVLGAALTSTTKNELGFVVGGPSFFNGVIYITSRFNGSSLPKPVLLPVATGPAPFCASVPTQAAGGICPTTADDSNAPRSSNAVPAGLCGPVALSTRFGPVDCDTVGRPNAVRLYNGARMPAGAFFRGLTIATDLPLYVYGDLNRVQPETPTPAHVKVAVVADRVTFLSRAWRDADHPWHGSAPPQAPPGKMVVEASVVTGLPLHGGGTHDIGDLFRTPQRFDDNHFILRGHLIAGFNSELDDRDDNDDRVNGGLRWLPDYHLDNPGFQPPGMPMLTLPPTARWRQRP